MSAYLWLWVAVIAAGLISWATKLAGHLVPQRVLDHPLAIRVAAYTTIALLAALAAVQTFGAGTALSVDARLPALAVAALLLWRKAPFIVVVAAAAGTAAVLRALGWG
ncbi:MAG: AzlD domain-containing protein [Demequinaceae bacterium]|nr:AzlD domain-containing protein [Demequinaceae bacterium]